MKGFKSAIRLSGIKDIILFNMIVCNSRIYMSCCQDEIS